jgi:hypothetical protein
MSPSSSVCVCVCVCVCVRACLSVRLSVCLFYCLSVCLSACLSVCLSVCLCAVYLSVCCLSVMFLITRYVPSKHKTNILTVLTTALYIPEYNSYAAGCVHNTANNTFISDKGARSGTYLRLSHSMLWSIRPIPATFSHFSRYLLF